MHLAKLPRDAVAYGRQHADLPGARPLDLSAYPQVAPMGPTPRTLREHVGNREFGSVATALAKADPTARRLSAVVHRARGRDAAALPAPTPRQAPRLIAMRDAVHDRAERIAGLFMMATSALLMIWIVIPVALTVIAGAL